jgi:hypothetical protein
VRLGGKKIVIITNAQDIAAVWKNITALAFDPFIKDILSSFGIPKDSIKRMF